MADNLQRSRICPRNGLMMTSKASREKAVRLLVDGSRKAQSQKLCLCGYDLNELPPDILSHPFPDCLEMLDLSNNQLATLDKEVRLLTNLSVLILSGNSLTKIPREIGVLRKLKELDLSRNCLESIPQSVNNLKELEVVNLSGNSLKIMPKYLLSLPKLLKVFCIRNPQLENIPKEVAVEGLEAMRDYLCIEVEVYESSTNEQKLLQRRGNESFLKEIEKSWVIDDDIFVRKTKDVSTQLTKEDEDSFENELSKKLCKLSVDEASTSTQTDLADEYVRNLGAGKELLFKKSYLIHKDQDIKKPRNKDKPFDENQAIENLVKIFLEQIKLVATYRAKDMEENLMRKSSLCDSVFEECMSKVSSPKRHCRGCGLKRRETFTSEYGSMSSCSHLMDDNVNVDQDGSCDGNSGSHFDDISNYDLNDFLENINECSSDYDDDDDIWCEEQQQYLNVCKELVIRQNGIEVKIPHITLSGHQQNEFCFEVVDNFDSSPTLEDNMILATPIVRVTPHGAKFYSSMEAVVKLPLNVLVQSDVMVRCFESDTHADELLCWKEIEPDKFEVLGGQVVIKTNHFSLFCATASKDRPSTDMLVSSSDGGTLKIEEVKGLEVHFPEKSLKSDMDVQLTVLYNDSKYASPKKEQTMAAPIVVLEPSGTNFDKDVIITLPLPDAEDVYKAKNDQKLIILESQTRINETPVWKELKVEYELRKDDGFYTVTFKVRHFTLFSAAWDGLVSTLKYVKRKAEEFVPQFTHRVFFQALMSDCVHTKQFGLCILCHLVGNPPVTDCSQFPIEVGRSKPRDLSKGEILIELKSKIFIADEEVGESIGGLVKKETFNGLDFDKQFALKFIDPFKEGGFGKVVVSREENTGDNKVVVDFLLQKTARQKPVRKPTALETKLAQEVAGLLSIDNRWKELAKALGYTSNEINTKFSPENPIEEILTDFMSRGGDDRQFIQALYEVARRLKLIPYDQMMENRENRRMESRIQAPTSSLYCTCDNSQESTPWKRAKRKLDDREEFDDEEERLTDARLDRLAGEIAEKWKHVGRALEIDQSKISEIDLNNRYEGGREKAFQMFHTWRELYPERYCTSVLRTALSKCGLNYTARRLYR